MPASTNAVEPTAAIQADLAARDLLPGEHLVDTGYVSGQHVLTSELAYGVDLVGPVLLATSWPATADEGFDLTRFAIDWERQTAAVGISLQRPDDWWGGIPRATTCTSRFAALAPR